MTSPQKQRKQEEYETNYEIKKMWNNAIKNKEGLQQKGSKN